MRKRIGSVAAFSLVLIATSCRQDQPNGPCGGVMDWGCSSPMECISTDNAEKRCVKPCDTSTLDCPPPGCCKPGLGTCRPVDLVVKRVTATPDQGVGIGWFCIPNAQL